MTTDQAAAALSHLVTCPACKGTTELDVVFGGDVYSSQRCPGCFGHGRVDPVDAVWIARNLSKVRNGMRVQE